MIKFPRRFNKTSSLQFLLSALLFAAAAGLPGPQDIAAAGRASICFSGTCFHPEIARYQKEKELGLMNRSFAEAAQGMIFIYDRDARPAFWMKNMLIPLDFVWLDSSGKVAGIDSGVPPCATPNCPTWESHDPIRYVLELPAGLTQKAGIKTGDQAVINLDENN